MKKSRKMMTCLKHWNYVAMVNYFRIYIYIIIFSKCFENIYYRKYLFDKIIYFAIPK